MKFRIALYSAALVLLAGCATPPQNDMLLRNETLTPASGRIGVAMTPLPSVDTAFPGAGCLLCYAAASATNSGLTSHAHTLPRDDLQPLKAEVAALLRKKGMNVQVVDEDLKLETLSAFASSGPNIAKKDFTPLQRKYQLDKLLVVQIGTLGFTRSYSAYIPTSDPKAVLQGVAYIVDLKSNAYEWYQKFDVQKSAEGKWDEPPKYPGLTNAYFQAIELGKDRVLQPLAQ
jgi:hypothetical protein